jgi:hypothetical protein
MAINVAMKGTGGGVDPEGDNPRRESTGRRWISKVIALDN